jgi:hypothetical protein
MSRSIETPVAIELNTKGEIVLKFAEDGTLDANDPATLLALMAKFAKEQKTTVNSYAYFCPKVDKDGLPVVKRDKAGKPMFSNSGKPVTETHDFADAAAREGRELKTLIKFGKPYIAALPATGKAKKAAPRQNTRLA